MRHLSALVLGFSDYFITLYITFTRALSTTEQTCHVTQLVNERQSKRMKRVRIPATITNVLTNVLITVKFECYSLLQFLTQSRDGE